MYRERGGEGAARGGSGKGRGRGRKRGRGEEGERGEEGGIMILVHATYKLV